MTDDDAARRLRAAARRDRITISRVADGADAPHDSTVRGADAVLARHAAHARGVVAERTSVANV